MPRLDVGLRRSAHIVGGSNIGSIDEASAQHAPELPSAEQLHSRKGAWTDVPRFAWWSTKALTAGTSGIVGIVVVFVLVWISLVLFAPFPVKTTLVGALLPAVVLTYVLVFAVSVIVWVVALMNPRVGVYVSTRNDAVLSLILRRRSRTIEPTNHVVRNVKRGQGRLFRTELGEPLFKLLTDQGIRLMAQTTSHTVRDRYLEEWGKYGLRHIRCGKLIYEPEGWARSRNGA